MSKDDVEIDIKKLLEKGKSLITNECCIYRVPLNIRQLNEDAYTPQVVSIGPFHHDSIDRLRDMESHKIMYCKSFLDRTHTTSESWISYIEGEEPKIRSCYSGTLVFDKKKLLEIIFVDCGFILELFWREYYDNVLSDDINSLSAPWLDNMMLYDLLLLENQLPFYVLDNLYSISSQFAASYDSTCGRNRNIPSFIQLTYTFFGSFNRSQLTFVNYNEIKHFTDLIRFFHLKLPSGGEAAFSRSNKLLEHLPSATELSEAGVRFKVTKSKCLLDLKFTKSVLEIPQLLVQDSSELVFRNMVALEQCHYPYKSYVTDYIVVLDFLVNTSHDVDLLVRKEILVNYLGDSDSAAKMINGLCKNVLETNFSFHYFRLCEDLNAFCRNPCRKLMSTLKRDYCKGPWQTAATIAAIVLLVLSFVQTLCSIWEVYKR
ncbi:hypothetical protein LR48_Vigan04g216500 [Vigna angularis]|uniref:Uncharacterized protein n=1 Tax=Phaseolus angularis TaxID=3914 RepID=A0A0L9UHD6_PHAAN|nr:hypothetical protein LR48_Vigan04g216500 [Vigna angularis]